MSYTKVYMDYFDYGEQDFIPCEICGCRSSEIHHIHARSQRKDLLNSIENIMAICRKDHMEYGDKKQYMEFLQETHNKFIQKHNEQRI
jgi:hypothetical protein